MGSRGVVCAHLMKQIFCMSVWGQRPNLVFWVLLRRTGKFDMFSIIKMLKMVSCWFELCDDDQAFDGDKCVGTIVCKMGQHRNTFRGYIAMLVVIKPYRGKGIGQCLSCNFPHPHNVGKGCSLPWCSTSWNSFASLVERPEIMWGWWSGLQLQSLWHVVFKLCMTPDVMR